MDYWNEITACEKTQSVYGVCKTTIFLSLDSFVQNMGKDTMSIKTIEAQAIAGLERERVGNINRKVQYGRSLEEKYCEVFQNHEFWQISK